MRRVVITGIGCVTPIGCGKAAFSEALKSTSVGIAPITLFDASSFKVGIAAEVKEKNFDDYVPTSESRRMDRFCLFGCAAAEMAVRDSGIDFEKTNRDRAGVVIGSGIGGFQTIETEHTKLMQNGPGRVSPVFIPMIISNMISGQVSMRYKLHGFNSSVVTACATSTHAIGDAFRLIKHGYADLMLAGGAEAAITPLGLSGFINITALTRRTDITRASIPFDKERDGFVMGEGAGIVVLEEYETARSRGAHIYCEITGYGATGDAYHVTAPDPAATQPARAMTLAMEEAGIHAADVGYINAHGTSTAQNDKMETTAIKLAFGEDAERIPVSSTKSMTGHLLGATGAVEAIACALAITESFIPATAGYAVPDPECNLNIVAREALEARVDHALSNSFGFGGHNATLALSRL